MPTAEQIADEIRQLPKPLQQEVLDFAHFLKHKAARRDLDDLTKAQETSLKRLWDNEEDEVWNDVSTR